MCVDVWEVPSDCVCVRVCMLYSLPCLFPNLLLQALLLCLPFPRAFPCAFLCCRACRRIPSACSAILFEMRQTLGIFFVGFYLS